MIHEEILKKLDMFASECNIDETGRNRYNGAETSWLELREEIRNVRCENCIHWTPKPIDCKNKPGVCRGWVSGMFSVESNNKDDSEVFWTWSDFGCVCFGSRKKP